MYGFITLCILIISPYGINWTYTTGIDGPLPWVFNHHYSTGLAHTIPHVFPHGPLAFFMYPTAENALIVLWATTVLRVFIIIQLFSIQNSSKLSALLMASISSYLLCALANFNLLIIVNVIILYCHDFNSESGWRSFVVAFLTAFALFVKAYVGIICIILFASYNIHMLLVRQKFQKVIIHFGGLLFMTLAIWLLMFRQFDGLGTYFTGWFHLASDNSSAAAYYPKNNWLYLGLALLTGLVLVLTNITKRHCFYFCLTILSIFAAWKHGMAREDIFHLKGLVYYLIACAIIFFNFSSKNLFVNAILSIIIISLFIANTTYVTGYKYDYFLPKKPSIRNLIQLLFDYEKLKTKNINQSKQNIFNQTLNPRLLEEIGVHTVDVYPWDYSVIPANNLNWKPRPILHSYAAYTEWLDNLQADHLASESAPAYFLWEINKITHDDNNTIFNSIDNRYLLNDEPLMIRAFIMQYKFVMASDRYLLYKKREQPLSLKQSKTEVTLKTTWNEWIKIPPTPSDHITTAQLHLNKTLLQSLKSLLYKDEQFYIYLKTKEGDIFQHRIVPKNATQGLWINPYIYNAITLRQIDEFMFDASNKKILSTNLELNIVHITSPNNTYEYPYLLADTLDITPQLLSTQDYTTSSQYWTPPKKNNDSTPNQYEVCDPSQYSSTFVYQLDSLEYGELTIRSSCMINPNTQRLEGPVLNVISIESQDTIIWKANEVNAKLLNSNDWSPIICTQTYQHSDSVVTLKVYNHNKSKYPISIDNCHVTIYAPKQKK